MKHAAQPLMEFLSDTLRERSRLLSGVSSRDGGEFVLYWMRTAVRAEENPALDAAITVANALQLPVLVYHALSERYPYASDRHHTFILQGARDVQVSLGERDIPYVFHLERRGHRGPHLKTLAERAALVVTEDMPAEPLRSWTNVLARSVTAPVMAVDTACIVPMQLVGQSYDRAFAYRKATKTLYEDRLTRGYVTVVSDFPGDLPADLPFEPIDLQSAELDNLVAQCEIDHTIGPVPHTMGGSVAGYNRWNLFKETKLSRYSKTRNNPLADGVSRLSAYLHYGMVSPQRVAREAAELDNEGAEKFLDELLIWRELAYVFCFYRPDHDRISALPKWAIETLAEHEHDPRPALHSWETLARGTTEDALWDAAQKSLLIQGELHNNVRMTWGKALLNWTTNAKQALAMLIDLNHRYALDGRDPASYGGLLWCLGQFDRPFPPGRQIFGSVRHRSTAQHAERLDPLAYTRRTTRPLYESSPSVAVIGAGISGLICARTLADHGIAVTVFEKSRGAGGRMSTRRTEDDLRFDHGAQYFTARDPRFKRLVNSWQQEGIVSQWQGRIVSIKEGEVVEEKAGTQRYIAMPGMNAICRHLTGDMTVHYESKVSSLKRCDEQWKLVDDHQSDLGSFDAVIVSAPAPQTAELLSSVSALAEQAQRIRMSGCWAIMVAMEEGLDLPFSGAFVQDSPLSWIARNSNKPGRSSQPETWILHASPEWSEANLEREATAVAEELSDEFWRASGSRPRPILKRIAHRWRFALPTEPLEERCLFDSEVGVGACGDWCGGPRVEGAFLSGAAVAGRYLGLLSKNANDVKDHTASQQQLF